MNSIIECYLLADSNQLASGLSLDNRPLLGDYTMIYEILAGVTGFFILWLFLFLLLSI
jgi:hypothetical protein